MLERTGLSSTLTFNAGSAIASMGRATSAFNGLSMAANRGGQTVIVAGNRLSNVSNTSKLLGNNLGSVVNALNKVAGASGRIGSLVSRGGVAVSNLGRAMGFTALAAAPIAIAMHKGAEEATSFEQAMANLKSVAPEAKPGEMQIMEDEIRRLGKTTKFNAIEVAAGFTAMRKSGIELQDTLLLGAPVTDLAVAGDMKLAAAAQLAAKVTQQSGLAYKDTRMLIDKMAVAARDTTSDIKDIGIAMSYAGGEARQQNIPLNQTIAAVGIIGKLTKEGSRTGTAFAQMLATISKKTRKGRIDVGGMAVPLQFFSEGENKGKLDLISTVGKVNKALQDGLKTDLERSTAISKFFPANARRAWQALSMEIDEYCKLLKTLETNYAGVAAAMAKMQLDTFQGQMTILKNTVTDLNIAFFMPIMKTLTPHIQKLSKFLGDVTTVMTLYNLVVNGSKAESDSASAALSKFGKAARSLGIGLAQAAMDISSYISITISRLDRLQARFFGAADTGQSKIITFVAKGLLLLGLLAPFIAVFSIMTIGVGALVSAAGSMIAAFGGIGVVGSFLMGGLLIPLAKVLLVIASVLAVAAFAFAAYRKEGESVIDTFSRLWADGIKPFIDGVVSGFMPVMRVLGITWNWVKIMALDALTSIVDAMRSVMESMGLTSNGVNGLGETFGAVAGIIAIACSIIIIGVSTVLSYIVQGATWVIKNGIQPIIDAIKLITFNVSEVVTAFGMMFNGNILSGLAKLGTALFSTLISPFSIFIKLLFEAAEGVLGIKVPESVRRLIEAPEFNVAPDTASVLDKATNNGPKATAHETGLLEGILNDFKDAAAASKDQKIDVNTCLHLDGREIHKSTSRYEKELRDRAGFKSTPWQRRMIAEYNCTSTSSVV